MELRVDRWKQYREQIKQESVLYKKISERNRNVLSIEKQLKKIDFNLLKETNNEDCIINIPCKENKIIEIINSGLDFLSDRFSSSDIEKIFAVLDKNEINIISSSTDGIDKFETLFKDNKFTKQLDFIKNEVVLIEKEHDGQKLELKKNKNYITQIISNEITKKDSRFINLKKNNLSYVSKKNKTVFLWIIVSLFMLMLILGIIFFGLSIFYGSFNV